MRLDTTQVDTAIIGGGAIGLAIAGELRRHAPNDEIVVVERCPRGRLENQSTRNSGVIHAGIYYKKHLRPLKARLCVEGNALLYQFCREHNVSHKQTGKLVVVTNSREEGFLDDVLVTALENDVPGVRLVTGAEAKAMERNVIASKALFAPTSGVIDAAEFVVALRRLSACHHLFETEVVGIEKVREGFALSTLCGRERTQERFVATRVINAAGLYSDEVAKLIWPECCYQILPVRGEAAKFYQSRRPELAVAMNVYPVPSGFYKESGKPALLDFETFQRLLAAGEIMDTVGVHLTPTLRAEGTLANTVTICPTMKSGVSKEDYGHQLQPPQHYLEKVWSYFPGLRVGDIELHQAGIQAKLAHTLDWVVESDANHDGFFHLVGIDSPGLTGSLAIARYLVHEVMD